MQQLKILTLWLSLVIASFSAGCGLADGEGAITLENGETVDADEIAPNARPKFDRSVVGVMYEGGALSSVRYATHSDAEAFYLMVQVDRGWDEDLNLQERQPAELRKFVGLDEPLEIIPLPRNIEPLGDELVEDPEGQPQERCKFVDTAEVGMLAFQCNGEFAVRAADSTDWTYLSDPGEGEATYVSRSALYYEQDPQFVTDYPVVYANGQRIQLAELPAALGPTVEHWIGPWDGERVRVLYKPDPVRLCAAVWTLSDGTVREDGCLEFEVPGAGPLSPGHIGGAVDETVFFGGGEINTVERGDKFWANIRPGEIEIQGRTSDRGNTLITVSEDLGGPHDSEYFATTQVQVGTGAGAQSLTFIEVFDADGGYDFATEFVETFTLGNPADICPDGTGLLKCRVFENVSSMPIFERVSKTRGWHLVDFSYDARRLILVQPLDVLLESEREISTTADPERVIDDYVPLSSKVSLPVWAQNVPGTFSDNVPSFVDLSECATVTNQDGVAITRDELQNFPIDIFDTHTIELDGCQPEDAGPPLSPLVVEAQALVDVPLLNPDGPNAWTMDGVVFTRGTPLPISAESPEVIGGADGAMILATDEGWSAIEASSPTGSSWSRTVIAPAGSLAPRFIGNRRYVVIEGGAVYGLDEGAVVTTMSGVTDPQDLVSLAHGQMLALETVEGVKIWSTTSGAPNLILERDGASGFLDASDGAEFLLEQDGQVVRVTETSTDRSVELVDLAGDAVASAEINADGSRALLWTTAAGRPTATLYELSPPTQTDWPVTSAVLTTLNSPHIFRRATGEVVYRNDVGPGQPDYRAFMIYTIDGQRVVMTQDSITALAEDAQGNLLWFDAQNVLKRMSWTDRVVEEVSYSREIEGNLDPDFYSEDGYLKAVAWGDWFLYESTGELVRVSAGSLTWPIYGTRGVEVAANDSSVDGGVAVWVGERGPDVRLIAPYEVGVFGNPRDSVRAFNLLFSARQEDGAFLRAPCMPFRIEGPQADYVTTPLSNWFCAR